MRLPPRPDLTWKDDGTPVDARVGDVYFSIEDGLAESRAVFLAGCGLPGAWASGADHTIAELGFGTGLNFLAAWQMWRAHRTGAGWLSFVSFEGYPLDVEDIARALTPWPELRPLAEKLCAAWPARAKGIRQITWPEERLTLTLHIGRIEDTLPGAQFTADAWFLDGFSPAKNAAMWDEALWPEMARRSRPGTRASTFTVAGAVRRGLQNAGFAIEKKPGHGRKRERLEAVFKPTEAALPRQPVCPPKVAIVGAGIAGASLARVLHDRGAQVRVYDRATGPGQGTSGNPMALVMPRLDAGETVQAQLLIDAYLTAQAFYQDRPGVIQTETFHRPRDARETERFAKLLADPPLGLEQLEALSGGGLLHKKSLIVTPQQLLPALLDGIEGVWSTDADVDRHARTVNGEGYDAVILASGSALAAICPELELTGRLGQVDWVQSQVDAPPSALACGHYAIASGSARLWGATFAAHSGGPPETSEAARLENAAALETLSPYWVKDARRGEVKSRAGVRATTADRLPLIGPLVDAAEMAADRQVLERARWQIAPEDYAVPGTYIIGGLGSRGFTWAPWAARLISADIFGDPDPATPETRRAIVPNRQILRKLKRQTG
ncbi:MAG: tRNA (5-methylaminomethyl-2-thiouridine)(34)-methyltransferase MnmD [Pseudomonadota bacterium]